MVRLSHILILSAILVRLFTQMFSGDMGYFMGRDYFDLIGLFGFFILTKGVLRTLVAFCIGLAAFSLVKPLFYDPTIDLVSEYIGLCVGFLCVIIQILYGRYSKRGRN